MWRAAIVLALLPGCFYVDPINQRPSIDIVQKSGAEVFRGSQVVLQADASDPEGQPVTFQWRAYACTDAGQPTQGCDAVPFYTELLDTATFTVPVVRDDQVTPVASLLVYLEGKDELGATARPIQQLILPVGDHPPDLTLRKTSGYGLVVDTPIDLFAKVGDPDDGPDAVAPLEWTVYSPANQPAYDLVDRTVPQDPADTAHLQLGKRFTPHGVGDWDIQVTARDPRDVTTVEHLVFTVVPDHAPCLGQWTPLDAPAGQALPMAEPTLFEVPVVTDDLDPYPSAPDAIRGTTAFTWSLAVDGGARTVLAGATSNRVSLDPAAFTPGDVLELRVEIADRNHTPITCADDSLTCSVISDDACLQRLTWRVEVQ